MKREDCYMTFTEALEQFLNARELMQSRPMGCEAWKDAAREYDIAKDHMNALTELRDDE